MFVCGFSQKNTIQAIDDPSLPTGMSWSNDKTGHQCAPIHITYLPNNQLILSIIGAENLAPWPKDQWGKSLFSSGIEEPSISLGTFSEDEFITFKTLCFIELKNPNGKLGAEVIKIVLSKMERKIWQD